MKTHNNSDIRTRKKYSVHGFRRLLGYAALASCWAAGQLLAGTATIYSNDFESYTNVATGLSDTSDADPASSEFLMQDDNPVGGVNGSGVQVINWLAHSGIKSLLFRSGTEARVSLFNPHSGSKYQFDFWLNVHKAPTGSHSFYFVLKGEGADSNGDDYVAYRSERAVTNDASIWYYDGMGPGAAAWVKTPAKHIEDTWQHHRLVVDTLARKMSIYIDDMATPVVTDADLARPDSAVPVALRIIHEGNTADDGYFAVDDISLTVEDAIDLTTTYKDGFENYPARTDVADDANPRGPWITVESDGNGSGKPLAPGKVQVVDASVTAPHSGSKCLKLEAGQRAGASLAWGVPPLSDVQITWWAKVPASMQGGQYTYLRMSLYGAENGVTIVSDASLVGDNALLGYGARDATTGDATSLTFYQGSGWLDTTFDYTPDTWEEYRLITHTTQGRYTIIKSPSSPNPQVIVDRAPMIGSATNWAPVFMAGWSSSNGTNHPPVYIDDIEVKSLVSIPDPLPTPYTVQFDGNRFTNVTMLNVGSAVGSVAVDPRDNSTIFFAVDAAPGAIYKATKVAAGNWSVDPTPVVSGLDRPSGMTVAADGTLWWVHDYTMALMRLKAPWSANTPEQIIADFGVTPDTGAFVDDDPFDVCIAPAGFSGSIGQPNMVVVVDRGTDGDAYNAVYLVDPATTELNQTNYNRYLVAPTTTLLGALNMEAITALPKSGEIATLCLDGQITAVDANGNVRSFFPTVFADPYATISPVGIAADPTTGRIWVADDHLDQVWSVAADGSGADQQEMSFPLTNPNRPDGQIQIHEPGMAFAPDGKFMVLSDTSTINGGGRLLIFHNEAIGLPNFSITSVTRSAQGVQLSWQAAGGAKYRVQRATSLTAPNSFSDISGDLTTTQFTDTETLSGPVFYRVVAKP